MSAAPRDFNAELAAARAAGDWDAHSRIWDERNVASVEHDEQAVAEAEKDSHITAYYSERTGRTPGPSQR